MKMLLASQLKKLLDNGAKSALDPDFTAVPVVKFFNPIGGGTWLLTELDPNDNDRAYGLCDLGMGEPELGYVSLRELFGVKLRFGLKIERDMHFTANKTIREYAKEARAAGRIVY